MMETVSSGLIPLSYVYGAYFGGRATVPVLRSQALYANFQHVSGVPAEAGTAAYSVDKLHILDVLIGRLESLKSQPLPAREAPAGLSPRGVDALIDQYSAQVHALVSAPALPYAPKTGVEAGMLFSFAA